MPVWDAKGNIIAKRGATIAREPQIAKSLRRRLILVRNCWMMIAVKHTRRPELEGDYLDVVEQYKDYILGTDCMPRTLLQRFIWTLLQRPGHFYSALGIAVSEKEQWLWQVCCNSHMYLNLAFWQFSHYGICLARNWKYLAIFLKAALTAATNSEDAASSHCQHKLPLMFTRKHSMAAMFQGNTHSMET